MCKVPHLQQSQTQGTETFRTHMNYEREHVHVLALCHNEEEEG